MNIKYQKLKLTLENLREQELLAPHTTFKIGGPADLFFEANTKENLIFAILTAQKFSVPFLVLGGGSNVLIGDKGFRGLVIKNNTNKIIMRGVKGKLGSLLNTQEVYVEAYSGVIMNKLIRFTIDEGLAGLEMHLGLPGSVGGSVYMNSKWTHPVSYIGDVVYQITILTPKGEVKTLPRSYFNFTYDRSKIQKTGDIVISVVFLLKRKNKAELWRIAEQSMSHRRETQTQGEFTAGCIFMNLTKAQAISVSTPEFITSAGYLLDHSGVKDLSVGGAQISSRHANFIINKDKASAQDVLKLIDLAKQKVMKKYGILLQEEIIKVGEF